MSKTFDSLRDIELATPSLPRLAAIPKASAQKTSVIHPADLRDPLEPDAGANGALNRRGTSRYLIPLFAGVLLISAAVIFARRNARGLGNARQAVETTSAGNGPATPLASSTVKQSISTLPATRSLNLSGFVLQVAAMKHEDNADTLAETLHQKSFPAFVFKRDSGPFYRVAIGVYGDVDSASKARYELEKQGFQAILRRWTPE